MRNRASKEYKRIFAICTEDFAPRCYHRTMIRYLAIVIGMYKKVIASNHNRCQRYNNYWIVNVTDKFCMEHDILIICIEMI